MTDIHKIQVTLSEPDIEIEPGSVVQLMVTMTNFQEAADRLLLEVEGVDVEWYMIPVSAVNVAPGAQVSERILFKVARNSENRAGAYPFLVRVQAMETGETGVAQATLTLKPFHHLQVELNPKRGLATFFHPLNEFEVTVSNQGNDEETLDLYASDPEDGCAYEFDSDRITLKPAQSDSIPMVVRPKTSSLLGGARLYGYTVSARAIDDAYVTANVHGQLEKRALISPLLGIFFLLLGFGALAYWKFRPVPPPPTDIKKFAAAYQTYDATQTRVPFGQKVKLTWDVFPPETHIVIKHRVGLKGVILEDPGTQKQTEGTIEVTPDPPVTVYTIVATGPGNQKAKKREIIINVLEAPKPPKPQIKTFTVDQDTVHAGEQVTFRWEGQGTEFIIDPGNVRLNQYARTFQTIPEKDTTYELRAHVEGNVITAAKVVKVKVVSKDVCIADINSFKPKNPDVYIGDKVKLRWSVHNARSVRIDVDHGEPIGEVRPGDAGVEATINDPTTYRLTATDSVGKTVSKDITVVPRQRPPAQETTPPLGGDTGTNAPEVRRTP